jgi:ADP-ribosyl-[dinitrogen reductase] hydrolase
MSYSPYVNALLGIAIGDALGVPVEFTGRAKLRKNPVQDMRGYGTYNQPPGTWSDDTALTLCLADALTSSYRLNSIAQNFIDWYIDDKWTATGSVFDVGGTTSKAIERLMDGISPEKSGMNAEHQNGNGSLMRILPLAFYLQDEEDPLKRFELVKEVSSITHAHFRSVFACFIYIEVVLQLLKGEKDKMKAYETAMGEVWEYEAQTATEQREIDLFKDVMDASVFKREDKDILGSGYVLHSLEASLWCWMKHDNYKDAVLEAVNLGDDTDTTAAITGGLAALTHGLNSVPSHWFDLLKRRDDIIALGESINIRFPFPKK